MDVMPGYKQTEVGVIPEDWESRRIDTVCRLINGRGFKPSEWQNMGLPIIRIQNLNGSDDFNFYTGAYDTKLEVESGQLLFAWSGSRGTSFGPHIWHGPLGLLNYHTWKVQVHETEIKTDFFLHALRQLTTFIEGKAHGASALVHTQKWEMEGFQFPFPPTKAEQEAIAEVLSDAEALIESLEQLLTKKRQIKKGAMQELLTGKKRLPGFSGEWEVRTFGDIFQYYPTANNSRSELLSAGDTFYIHYGDIHTKFHNHLDFGTVQPPRIDRSRCPNAALLKNGDWVMADASEDHEGVGKSIEVQGLNANIAAVAGLHTFLLREKNPIFSPGFKGHLGNLKSLHEQFRRVATGMKVFGVSKAALNEIELPVPHPKEQAAIATILSDMDAEIAALEVKLSKAHQIKQGMMQELLTGRIRLV